MTEREIDLRKKEDWQDQRVFEKISETYNLDLGEGELEELVEDFREKVARGARIGDFLPPSFC